MAISMGVGGGKGDEKERLIRCHGIPLVFEGDIWPQACPIPAV